MWVRLITSPSVCSIQGLGLEVHILEIIYFTLLVMLLCWPVLSDVISCFMYYTEVRLCIWFLNMYTEIHGGQPCICYTLLAEDRMMINIRKDFYKYLLYQTECYLVCFAFSLFKKYRRCSMLLSWPKHTAPTGWMSVQGGSQIVRLSVFYFMSEKIDSQNDAFFCSVDQLNSWRGVTFLV